ncbi:MAG TPA: hypothetical protein VJN96_06845 [Vicinamibacterales bacterium]|nr:hypothetical protein [Vicinamibacterales bacterium]
MLLGPIVLAGFLVVGSVQTPPPVAQPDYRFPSGAGLLFFYVKPARTADFEAVIARLSEVLDKTDDPVRKQQAANWHILRSVETTPDAAIYVFMFVPAVAGTDYDPIKVLGEALPTEVQGLYEKLRDAVIRVERMGLGKIR